jgi:hypothetical protein
MIVMRRLLDYDKWRATALPKRINIRSQTMEVFPVEVFPVV